MIYTQDSTERLRLIIIIEYIGCNGCILIKGYINTGKIENKKWNWFIDLISIVKWYYINLLLNKDTKIFLFDYKIFIFLLFNDKIIVIIVIIILDGFYVFIIDF